MPKGLSVRQDVSQRCSIVEAKQFLLRREDFEIQREAVSSMETWETNGCLCERSVDCRIMLFPVILLCINSSFP